MIKKYEDALFQSVEEEEINKILVSFFDPIRGIVKNP